MSRRNLLDIFNEIDTDLIEDAANIKNQIPDYTVNEGESMKKSKSENTVTEVYKIEAETHTRKNYVKYAVSAATVLFIAGLAGITAGLNLSQDKENNSVAEVSRTINSSADTDRAENDSASAVSETESGTVSVTAVSETASCKVTLSETAACVSEKTSGSDEKSNGNQNEGKPADNHQQTPEDNDEKPVTEKPAAAEISKPAETENTVITETVKQTEPVKAVEELSPVTDGSVVHLPCMPAEPGYPDGAITLEGFAQALESLSYSPFTCDGIPTNEFTAPDGTVYYILEDCIHRKNAETGQMEEAARTEPVDFWIIAFTTLYGLAE